MVTQRILHTRRLANRDGYKAILNLACGHNIHINQPNAGRDTFPCPYCPTEPTKAEDRREEPVSNWFDQSKNKFTRRRTCYYAHCMSLYNTPQEQRDVETLRGLGLEVVNPNDPEIEARARSMKDGYAESPSGQYSDGSAYVMYELFKPLAQKHDVLAFRSLPDGTIPAGVAKEIQWAIEAGKTIIELPSGLSRRTLSLEATREYLREVGQR